MFREMRRKRQELPESEAIAMLQSCTSGVLAVNGDNGYPYAVPLSFAYADGKIFFHFARNGHKLDGMMKDARVSFCAVADDDVAPEAFTTRYRSVIAFGQARILTDDSERRHALRCLLEKYSPDYIEKGEAEIERGWDQVCVAEVAVEHLTGKAGIEIIREREPGV